MFELVDLNKKMDKTEFKQLMPDLRERLGEAQRRLRDDKISSVILFEGWEAARMASIINKFLLPLDPRGFSYNNMGEPEGPESERPFLYRFWMKTPTRGRIAIFDRSWYAHSVADCFDNGKCKHAPPELIHQINLFEKMLNDDGTIVIKMFLHTKKPKASQKVVKGDLEACGLADADLDTHKFYDKLLPIVEETIQLTDTPYAPWNIIEAEDEEYTVVKVFRTVLDRLEARAPVQAYVVEPVTEPQLPALSTASTRKGLDLTKKVSDIEYQDKLDKYQSKMRGIQCDLHSKKRSIIVLFEGRDAAGKGGDIARITQGLNPRTYEVVPVIAPNDEEKAHQYLWRFYRALPPRGHLTIFDRSWYGRVLVERVEHFATEGEWRRAYQEINEFERMLVDDNIILVKIWLEIDKETQLKRFIERVDDPKKTWKISIDDWKAREKWDDYSNAIDEMLLRTSTSGAPWTVVESNDKNHSRLKSLRTIIDAAEKGL
jgi:AMP-polyphosphate phosphotransferase